MRQDNLKSVLLIAKRLVETNQFTIGGPYVRDDDGVLVSDGDRKIAKDIFACLFSAHKYNKFVT